MLSVTYKPFVLNVVMLNVVSLNVDVLNAVMPSANQRSQIFKTFAILSSDGALISGPGLESILRSPGADHLHELGG